MRLKSASTGSPLVLQQVHDRVLKLNANPLTNEALQFPELTPGLTAGCPVLASAGYLTTNFGAPLRCGRPLEPTLKSPFLAGDATVCPCNGVFHDVPPWGSGLAAVARALRPAACRLARRCRMRRPIRELPLPAGCTDPGFMHRTRFAHAWVGMPATLESDERPTSWLG